MNFKIEQYTEKDSNQLTDLIADFRITLAKFRGVKSERNIDQAKKELIDYTRLNYHIFVAKINRSEIAGYIVCKIEKEVVWAESMYVKTKHRRKGIASALYSEVEKISIGFGNDTLYNWIHPNNVEIISFLRNRGYSVLNLIEIRKVRKKEKVTGKICVGKYEFDYGY
ncbi:MAG: GNAT family N-acetyltransferase [Candidatus Heimdallarchaeota archaeon]|nr:GNAT family N-acetyltransferase [Candidatus Heimdallarchaeota archaeon]